MEESFRTFSLLWNSISEKNYSFSTTVGKHVVLLFLRSKAASIPDKYYVSLTKVIHHERAHHAQCDATRRDATRREAPGHRVRRQGSKVSN